MDTKEIMSVKELCVYLGIGKSTVYINIIKTKKIPIPFFRLGASIRFRRQDVDIYMENERRS
jgi:excisionase family DNA binding protein